MIKNKFKENKNSGFIALISVVIISFVLLLVATTLGLKGFYSRFNILASEFKSQSDELADACVEHARLLLAIDKTINDSGVVTGTTSVGTNSCDYTITTASIIIGHGTVSDTHTYYKAIVNETSPTIPITSFGELPTYP